MIPRDLKVETEDICICLGNLLDNAIEASKKVKAEERSVCVEIRVDRRNLMMMVSNHYEEERKSLYDNKKRKTQAWIWTEYNKEDSQTV